MSNYASKTDVDTAVKSITDVFETKISGAVADLSNIIANFADQVADEFKEVRAEQAEMRKDISRILKNLDALSKKQEIDDDERLVMGHQLDRLDMWVHQVADKIGYKLNA